MLDGDTIRLFENIKVEVDDGVGLLILNRPHALNALNSALLADLADALDDMLRRGVKAIVLTGAGPKAFAAGADIAEMRGYDAATATFFAEKGQRILDRLENAPVPVIAAVNGFALGGGCELAMACDIILAAKNARFGQPEVALGVIPGFGGTQRLTRLVGRQRARELCFTGRHVLAEEAVQIGLALKVCDDVMASAKELAASIAKNGPRAVSLAKRSINAGADLDLKSALAIEASLFGACFATEDQKEGMGAFLDKRAAQFKGR